MALRDLLFRCPFCGQEPVLGEGIAAECPGCGRAFEPGRGKQAIQVTTLEGGVSEHSAASLVERLSNAGAARGRGAEGSGTPAVGAVALEAAATMRRAFQELPVRVRGGVLGFAERFGPRMSGTLRLDDEVISFVDESGGTAEWALRDVRALQGSSSEIQISPVTGGVIGFRLTEDSPRRWEEALKARLRSAWRREGKGEIVEFQPRIRSG